MAQPKNTVTYIGGVPFDKSGLPIAQKARESDIPSYVRDSMAALRESQDRGEGEIGYRRRLHAKTVERKLKEVKDPQTAQALADQDLFARGEATSKELQELADIKESFADRSETAAERTATRFRAGLYGRGLNTIATLQNLVGADESARATALKAAGYRAAAEGATEQQKYIVESGGDIAGEIGGVLGDPAFAGMYGLASKAIRGFAGAPTTATGRIALDAAAGVPADIASTSLATGGDVEKIKEEVGYGVAGAVGLGVAGEGIGRLWKRAFPDEPLPASRAEAERRLSSAGLLDEFDARGGRHDLRQEVSGAGLAPVSEPAPRTPALSDLKPLRPNDVQYQQVSGILEDALDIPIARKGGSLFVDTRGTGAIYHGAKSEVKQLYDWHGSELNYYGPGLYTTDAADVARGYQRGSSEGVTHSVSPSIPDSALFNLDVPFQMEEARALMPGVLDSPYAINVQEAAAEVSQSGGTWADFYDALRRSDVPAYEVQEDYGVIAEALESKGFRGLVYRGGGKTKTQGHTVRQYWLASQDVSIRPTGEPDVSLDVDGGPDLEKLLGEGASASEARALLSPEMQLGAGLTPDGLRDVVDNAIGAGQWSLRASLSAAKWVASVSDTPVRTMREFTQALIKQFGRGIRKFIPDAWSRYKSLAPSGVLGEPRNFAQDKASYRASKSLVSAKRQVDYAIDPIADRLEKISPRLSNRMYRFQTEANIKAHQHRQIMDPVMSSREIKKLPADARNRLKSALLNARPDQAGEIADAIGGDAGAAIREMMARSRQTLDSLFEEAKDVGMDARYLENFWPRSIRPGQVNELRSKLSGAQKSTLIDALKDEAILRYDGDVAKLTPEERASVLDRVIAGYGPRGLDSSRPAPLKPRSVSQIPDEYLQYYRDFDESMDIYIQRMSNEIAKRRLLGGSKGVDLTNQATLSQSIGAIIDDIGVPADRQDEVAGMIRSVIRGGEAPASKTVKTIRDGSYILTMGQVTSAMRQAGDLATTATVMGPVNTLKALARTAVGKNHTTLLDLGLDRIAEEYAGAGSSKAVDLTFKLTGLDFLDRRVIKNASIDAALLQAQSRARKRPAQMLEKLRAEFGDDADDLLKDIQEGQASDLLKVYLTTRLGNIQPITRLEVPQGYLDARQAFDGSFMQGAPSLAYQLKTFQLRRIGLMRKQGLHKIVKGTQLMRSGRGKEGRAMFLDGAKALAAMFVTFTAADAAVDQAINYVFGGDDSVVDSLTDSLLQYAMSNRYGYERLQQSGAAGYTALFAPASGPTMVQILTDIGRIAEGKEPITARKLPHAKTIGLFLGDDDGPQPPRPPQPPQPPRPPRP